MLDVTQHHDLPLCLGQLRQERLDAGGELLGHEVVVDPIRPRHGRRRPVALGIEALPEVFLRPPRAPLATGC